MERDGKPSFVFQIDFRFTAHPNHIVALVFNPSVALLLTCDTKTFELWTGRKCALSQNKQCFQRLKTASIPLGVERIVSLHSEDDFPVFLAVARLV